MLDFSEFLNQVESWNEAAGEQAVGVDTLSKSFARLNAVPVGQAYRQTVAGAQPVGGHLALSLDLYCTPNVSSSTVMTANVTGMTAALNALASAGGGKLVIPAGNWYFNGPVTCTNWKSITIEGEGFDASVLYVSGLGSGVFIDCTNTASAEINHCRLLDFSIIGNGGLTGATAIRQTNWSRGNIRVRIFNWVGSGAVGIACAGRELVEIEAAINADAPIRVVNNPAQPGGGLDHYVFHNLRLWTMAEASYAWAIAYPSNVSTTTFTGTTTVCGDGGGLDFSLATSLVGVTIGSMRHESALLYPMTGWSVNLDASVRGDNVTLIGVEGKFQMLRARHIVGLTLIGCKHEHDSGAGAIAVDVDETCDDVSWSGLWSLNGSVLTGALHCLGAAPPRNAGEGKYYAPNAQWSNKSDFPSSLARRGDIFTRSIVTTLAKTATYATTYPAHEAFKGIVTISASATEIDATTACGIFNLTSWGPMLVTGTTNMSQTDTAGKLCFFVDAGTGNATLKNNTGRDLAITLSWN